MTETNHERIARQVPAPRSMPCLPKNSKHMKGCTLVTGRVQSRTLLPEVVKLVRSRQLDPDKI